MSGCASFGERGAEIQGVALYTKEPYQKTTVLQGGERVIFYIDIQIYSTIEFPVISFIMNDEYGNHILGTKTFVEQMHIPALHKSERILGQFEFQFPLLRNGRFSFNPAIAEGTQDTRAQHHWVHDTYFVQVANPDKRWNLGWYFILNNLKIDIYQKHF